MKKFVYCYCPTIDKRYHVVASNGEARRFSVASFHVKEVAEEDAADRNRRAKELKVPTIYLVEPIENGEPGEREKAV